MAARLSTLSHLVGLWAAAAAAQPHIIFIVADDLGYNDIGAVNGNRTHTPNIDALRAESIVLTSYHTFKICSPSRASMFTGRYPWGAGFYDMSNDFEHTTVNFTIWPGALSAAGYATDAIGKWDNGAVVLESTPTYRGFDRFFGYYVADQAHYWYHWAGGLGAGCNASAWQLVDFSDSSGAEVKPAGPTMNGTYSTELFAARAEQWIAEAAASAAAATTEGGAAAKPLALYFAPMNVHEAAGPGIKATIQAPLGTIAAHYNYTKLDVYKVMGGMLTELDTSVGRVITALKSGGLWDNSVVVFVSDNGGPLDHSTNAPLRGGKHTFFEGGLRVTGFIGGGIVPPSRRGTTWDGLMHAADWYATLIAGIAKAPIPPTPNGSRPLDGFDMWDALLTGAPSPRTEIVHQVNNSYFSENASAITVGDMKLIRGPPGDNRTVAWPSPAPSPVPLGLSGATIEPGTDHVVVMGLNNVTNGRCEPWCLFNLTADPNESHNLCCGPEATTIATSLISRLDEAGRTGPPNSWTYGTNQKKIHQAIAKVCDEALHQPKHELTIEPVDWNASVASAA